mmetsp:Transcript_42305/g.111370  ORF Transcript_42305/g.111370 Transcript_42305/m.111370 type:complete len:184 (-) Transcript_42305:376-927(-)
MPLPEAPCSDAHTGGAPVHTQYGSCKVCFFDFTPVIEKLNKRQISQDEVEMEIHARKRRRAFEDSERAKNVEWARCVAPSVAHILYRHFRHASNEPQVDLGFNAIVLSLIHSGEQYVDDLAERLAESRPRPVVDDAVRRLLSIGDSLGTSDEVDMSCSEEFMRHFSIALASERNSAPAFRWNE